VILVMCPSVYAQNLFSIFGINSKTSINDTRIGDGLKEALRVGTDKTVKLLGKKDGYYANKAVKILMPKKIQDMEGFLRKTGLGPRLDEFVLSMNRAAETAAPHARDIFIEAIGAMSLEDAQSIYRGGDTAATQYFQSKTYKQLAKAYRPIVLSAMQRYNVTNKYIEVSSRMQAFSLVRNFNLEEYVVNKSLEGLFYSIAQQEKEIRVNPSARVTGLLKQVFSNQVQSENN
jgi:hypothetical protein